MADLDHEARKLMEWNNPFGVRANDRNFVQPPAGVEVVNWKEYHRSLGLFESKKYGGPSSDKYTLSSDRFDESMRFGRISSFYEFNNIDDAARMLHAKLHNDDKNSLTHNPLKNGGKVELNGTAYNVFDPQGEANYMQALAAQNLGVPVAELDPRINQSIERVTGVAPAPVAALRAVPVAAPAPRADNDFPSRPQVGDRESIERLNALRVREGMPALSQEEYDAAGKKRAPVAVAAESPQISEAQNMQDLQGDMTAMQPGARAARPAALGLGGIAGMQDFTQILSKQGPIGDILKAIFCAFAEISGVKSPAVDHMVNTMVFGDMKDKIFAHPDEVLSREEFADRFENLCREWEGRGDLIFENTQDREAFYDKIPAASMQMAENISGKTMTAETFFSRMSEVAIELNVDVNGSLNEAVKDRKFEEPGTVYNTPVTLSAAEASRLPFKGEFEVHEIDGEGNLRVMTSMNGADLVEFIGGDKVNVEQYAREDGSRGYFISDENKRGVYVAGDVLDRATMDPELIRRLNTEPAPAAPAPAPAPVVGPAISMATAAPGFGMSMM